MSASLKSAQDPYCSNGPFRVALSLSPFSMNQFDDGYQFIVNNDTAKTVEVRFGKYITDRWYIMGELTYHVSLADETACIEPAIRVGYNFGRKIKTKK